MAYVSSLWATIVARLDSRRGRSGETIIKVKHRGSLLAAAALSLAFVMAPVPGAQAASITVTGLGFGGSIATTNAGTIDFAGQIETNLNTGPQILNNFIVFCLEYNVPIGFTTYNATISNDGTIRGAAVTNAGRIAWLMQTYAAGVDSQVKGEALQAAIWHLANGVNLALTDPAYSLYSSYLAASLGQSGALASMFWITPLSSLSTNPARQGLIGIDVTYVPPPPPPPSVPEPGSLALLGLGLLGLGLSRRRKAA